MQTTENPTLASLMTDTLVIIDRAGGPANCCVFLLPGELAAIRDGLSELALANLDGEPPVFMGVEVVRCEDETDRFHKILSAVCRGRRCITVIGNK